jgi:carboxymethylenebutenolidase
MTRLTANDFHPEVLRLFDAFVHGNISRGEFIDGASEFATAGETGVTLLQALSPDFSAIQVEACDPRIQASYVEFSSPEGNGKARGYLVKPANVSGKLPGVLVVHENRGLNPHIMDIARRLALENFVAFAPDALFTVGGYPGDEEKARELFASLDRAKIQQDCLAAAVTLKSLPDINGNFGAIGFCFGGGTVNFIATRLPDLGAAVPFYGGAPKLSDVPNIESPLMFHYAEHDDNINRQWPAYQTALEEAGIAYTVHHYPGTQHGFNNDTTPRYDAASAQLAWTRTVAFLDAHLKGRI